MRSPKRPNLAMRWKTNYSSLLTEMSTCLLSKLGLVEISTPKAPLGTGLRGGRLRTVDYPHSSLQTIHPAGQERRVVVLSRLEGLCVALQEKEHGPSHALSLQHSHHFNGYQKLAPKLSTVHQSCSWLQNPTHLATRSQQHKTDCS